MASILAPIIETVLLAASAFLIEEPLGFIIGRAAKRAGASSTLIRDIRVALRIIAILVVASGILSITGLASEFTALTISGIGAIAVSLALQTTLTNIISGFLLLTDGIVRVNDEVEFGSVKGKIVRVALRNTWIMSEDGKIAVISNSNLSNGPLINRTAVSRLSKRYEFE